MSPISQERLDWINTRLNVIDACVKMLTRRAAFYHQQLGSVYPVQNAVLTSLKTEELQLTVEKDVLETYLGERALKAIEDMGVTLPGPIS